MKNKRGTLSMLGQRRGQFYLIVALMIIMIVISVALTFNYSNVKKTSKVYNLGNELEIESEKVLDYGAMTGSYPWGDFTKNFTDYAGKEINITYIVGNVSSHQEFYYENGTKQIVIPYIDSSQIIITNNNLNYTFNLLEGENFYFIISQDINGEYYVATN